MKIKSLHLFNFRNYKNNDFNFFDGINFIIGNNAQGKTNILESIYLMCTTKSFRTRSENNLIKFGEDKAKILINFVDKGVNKDLSIIYERNGSKDLFVNSKKVKKNSSFIGNLKAAILIPEDIYIIKGDESIRRRFLDISLCQVDRLYLEKLIAYTRVLRYRNWILKSIKLRKASKKELDPWNLKIAEISPYIIEKRNKFVIKINDLSNKYNKMLSNDSEKLRIEYIHSVSGNEKGHDNYGFLLMENLEKIYEEEIRRGISMIGPHRDEIAFELNGVNLKYFGSQGQQRTAAISLRLAEAEIMKLEILEAPIILVDDIFSELDETRRANLLKLFDEQAQVFLTGTAISEFRGIITEGNKNVFYIREGNILNSDQ